MSNRHMMEPDPEANVSLVEALWTVAAVLAVILLIALVTQ